MISWQKRKRVQWHGDPPGAIQPIVPLLQSADWIFDIVVVPITDDHSLVLALRYSHFHTVVTCHRRYIASSYPSFDASEV